MRDALVVFLLIASAACFKEHEWFWAILTLFLAIATLAGL